MNWEGHEAEGPPPRGRLSWNQAICWSCWRARNGDRIPYRIRRRHRRQETCSYCGRSTRSEIFVRDNPHRVPFPRRETDSE